MLNGSVMLLRDIRRSRGCRSASTQSVCCRMSNEANEHKSIMLKLVLASQVCSGDLCFYVN